MKKLIARTKFIISKTPVAFSKRMRNMKNPRGTATLFRRKKELSKKMRIELDSANNTIIYILEGGIKKIKTVDSVEKQTIANHLTHDFDVLDAIGVRQFTCNYYWYLL
ncbi:hypothetical protein COT62_00645 [Candidatus Roizmanbacteria bacterium CG09_land_8_20_14_0_10_41_9]|uniref:Uncharacterized protein n=1 Tax=Candidatus Roizmanbacteria bacterium CG09_land_8_20_14_0_10_41_9 TaxID=1974850 RepID=A0A2H0WTM2_9BACT|nr:MAG: hypothetical protein COT62_00645 [Candidatus Roizmanbacteria bacterium CG09_land_8_20_14_0_10_41_9]